MRSRIVPTLIVASLLCPLLHAVSSPSKADVVVEDLGPVPEDRLHEEVIHTGPHIAWIIKRAGKARVVWDGQPGAWYDEIEVTEYGNNPYVPDPNLGKIDEQLRRLYEGLPRETWYSWLDRTRDGKRWAYIARRGNKWHAVMDGVEEAGYDEIGWVDFSPSGRRAAYTARLADRWFLIVDGIRSRAYDDIHALRFSENEERLACVATQDGAERLVVDGKAGPPHDDIDTRYIVFSNDSKRMGYVAKKDSTWHVVIDGSEGPGYRYIGGFEFSPDGQHVAYPAMKGPKPGKRAVWLMVIDGKEGPEYGVVQPERYTGGPASRPRAFSPEGNRVAYHAKKDGKSRVIVDGYEGPAYDQVANLKFSPDGQHVAYKAKRAWSEFIVFDGEPGPKYDRIGEIEFSPDGNRLFYEACSLKWLLVVDGRPGVEHDRIGGPSFSPDGQHVAYVGVDDGLERMYLDGEPASAYTGPCTFVFSPDSQRLAYSATQDDKTFMVLDGQPGPKFDGVFFPFFSPDSRLLTYGACLGEKELVVCGSYVGPRCDEVYPKYAVFSEDGRHWAYQARRGDHWHAVIDGQPGSEFDRILLIRPQSGPTVQYLATRESRLYRVTHDATDL